MSHPESTSFSGTPSFAFVKESGRSESRRHAMREHWKRRHRHLQERRSYPRQASRTLRPRSDPIVEAPCYKDNTSHDSSRQRIHADEHNYNVAAQLLSGMSYALLSSKTDPFQTCPVHLTSQHQKLLHHWICTHAAMMFEEMTSNEFNPMRDVWFPLDLSNASSFNCIIAHSAAHLAHLYAGSLPRRDTKSSDALKYKAEAVKILLSWMADPKKSLSDDAFAAVIRLLTFERYWGTDTEWKIHRGGLERMIHARGGIDKLHENWRLKLVVYLVSLMARPSWLESANNLEEISGPLSQSLNRLQIPSIDLHKVRCLWLISFIQDMRTFMGYFNGIELSAFPSLRTATRILRENYLLSVRSPHIDSGAPDMECEMLACLFSIGIILQYPMSRAYEDTTYVPGPLEMQSLLDTALQSSEDTWCYSIHNLQSILYSIMMGWHEDWGVSVNYVLEMVKVLSTLSLEARQGVARCLLNLFYSSTESGNAALIDDGWTPDSLLSSVRGH